ncbi:MAG: hypothetical protein ACXVCP_09590 [Bdellovibrio sp.]
MKNSLTIYVLGMILSSTTMASTSKVCFGSKNNNDTNGVVLTAEIDAQNITLNAIKGDFYYNGGTYPVYKSTVKGRDGKTYVTYKGQYTDYQEYIVVDEALLQSSTTGLLKIRARGEGFFNSVFVCKDAN